MNANEVIELLKTSKSKRKGIDKDTKEAIRYCEQKGLLGENVADNPHFLVSLGGIIANSMNDNDYFNAEELARITLSLNEDLCTNGYHYEKLLETIYRSLKDKAWAEKIIEKMKKLKGTDVDVMSLINAGRRQGSEYEGDDKDGAVDTLKFAINKVENAAQLFRLTKALYDLDEKELATELVVDAIKENRLNRIDEIMDMFFRNYQDFRESVENALR